MRTIQVLDCTLRDGGLGLEDANINGISTLSFKKQDMATIANKLSLSGVDIIELGSIEETPSDKTGFAIFPSIQAISKTMPKKKKPNQLFAALFRGPDIPVDKIPSWNNKYCEAVRVILRYSELRKSLDFCASLSKKGYKVFVQPMLTMRYSKEEIDLLVEEANKMDAYALYFVDSYGYMQIEDVVRLFNAYDKRLKPNIRIGFHSHNNMNLAFSNVIGFLNLKSQRSIIVDSCLTGMGQGAGNLQTELLVGYLNQHNGQYCFDNILDACEVIEKYNQHTLWGYSVDRMLPALYKCAYKYAIVMRHKYSMSYKDINSILSNMNYDLKQRYTIDNLKKVVGKND